MQRLKEAGSIKLRFARIWIENFTGQKPAIMEQDVYTTIYLSNIINDILQEASSELERTASGKHEMQINRGLAAGIVKEELFHLLMEENFKKKEEIIDAIINEIKKNLLPVRKGRIYGRSGGKLASKYSNTRKRYV